MRKTAAIGLSLAASVVMGCGQSTAPVNRNSAATTTPAPAGPASPATTLASQAEPEAVGLAAPGPLTPVPQADEVEMEALQPVPAKSPEPSPVELAFEKLLAAAESGQPDDWAAAERELQTAGVLAVPVLVRHLEDENAQARELAVMFLAQIGPEAAPAAPALVKLLVDPSELVQVNAAATLVMIGDHSVSDEDAEEPSAGESAERVALAVRTLAGLADYPEENVRMTAVSALGNAGPAATPALKLLRAALGDANPQIRATAAAALGRLGPVAATQVAALKALADDEDAGVRNAAAVAVRQIESPDAPGEAIPASATEK